MPIVPLIIAVLLAGGAGTVALANDATPGSPLFGIDQAIERVQERFATNPEAKARLLARFSEERAAELAEIINMTPEQLEERAQQRWAERQQLALDHLSKSLERVNALRATFQEKLDAAENDDQKAAYEQVIKHLDEVAERREARIDEAEAREFPGTSNLPIRERLRELREDMDPAVREEIHRQMEELGEDLPLGPGSKDGMHRGRGNGDDDAADVEDDDSDDLAIAYWPQPPFEFITPQQRERLAELREQLAGLQLSEAERQALQAELQQALEDLQFEVKQPGVPNPEPMQS